MSSQSADQPAPDQTPAPVGMRELPPQPAKPVMPAYTMPAPGLPLAGPLPVPQATTVPQAAMPGAGEAGPGPEDSVIARDDHFEGTFTSRGTICVMGSVKGRIEAVRVRIEEGATVDADVIVDEAIVAGNFTGNLTCRERLEARPSGRINGRVETYRLMLHEGARVEGEMHMLTEAPRDASMTIRGSAPVRGETTLELTQPVGPGGPRGRQAGAERHARIRGEAGDDQAGGAASRAGGWRHIRRGCHGLGHVRPDSQRSSRCGARRCPAEEPGRRDPATGDAPRVAAHDDQHAALQQPRRQPPSDEHEPAARRNDHRLLGARPAPDEPSSGRLPGALRAG